MEISHEHGMGHMGMGGGMMAMAPPIHLHDQSFQIVSRSIDSSRESDYVTVNQGFINSGLKDTVSLYAGRGDTYNQAIPRL
ncbi:MAG: multicopper oxidase domain-containing protein [Methyloglobulus sp.]|nr:multicopper oxidase domain-containing protein [Methyloglobulus sp.]